MDRYPLTRRFPRLTQGIGGLIVALVVSLAFFGCKGDTTNNTQSAPASTVGALNVTVTPASAEVVVTGPSAFTQSFTGNQFIGGLEPGDFTAQASEPGFADAVGSINVVAGQTSSISLILQPTPIISEAPRAVYRDGQGNLVPLAPSSLQSGKFVFYAWLEDEPLGILTTQLISTIVSDPGQPLVDEQNEFAPSFTQNLATAWVGYTDDSGVVRPVIGADVRWEIDQQFAGRVGSTQFGTSDDNRVALGYGVFDDQADTRTNNSRLQAQRFPLIASEFPLYNQSGIGTPFVDGFTWVTLFSPDAKASARIVAVATINGEEIGKQILYKNFAPTPVIEITKTVDQELINLGGGGTGTVTWTITVKNTGSGDAANIDLSDTLASGDGLTYTATGLPVGSTPVGDGFTYPMPSLASALTPAPPQTAQLLGNAQSFAALANGTVTNTGSSVVSGQVGVSAGSAVTGFPPGIVLNGTIHFSDLVASAAQTAVTAAYVDLQARTPDQTVNTALTGTLGPGIYPYSSSAAVGGELVLDGQGDPNAEFVFQIGSTLTTGDGSAISLINGASACNVYWQVGSSATLGSNSFFVGNVLAQASVTANGGANIAGRLLARTGSVTLDTNAINAPLSCVAAPGTTQTVTFTADITAPGTYCNRVEVVQYEDDVGNVTTPADLSDQACVIAVAPSLSIVKDFVAADNTTSLGPSRTVAANVPAKLRVRVINAGGGLASAVTVSDAFDAAAPTTGLLANYQLVSVSSGTPNASGGFDTTIGDIPAGETVTLLFTVVASVDGVYCDTATTGALSDTACLTVATPDLTITKADVPGNVVPGATYTSTIIVNNIGTATAQDVVISDSLGVNAAANVQAIYVSSSLNGAGGTLANNTVTAKTVTIPAGGSVTFTVVSRIPLGAVSGTYCDTATVTSSNAPTKEASDCVDVPAFSALQTELFDLNDPVAVGSNATYFSVLYVEELSNEGVSSTELTYSFGLTSPTVLGIPGVFQVLSTKIYLDTNPILDPITGLVVSDTSNPTAVLLAAGSDYTIDNSTPGLQLIVMDPNVALQPDTALYLVHVAEIPVGTATNKLYTTSYIWDSVGLVNPSNTYQASSSEATTVLP